MTADRACDSGPSRRYPRMTWRAAILLAGVVGAFCTPTPASADWRKDYREALETIEQERWLDAARLLRQSLASNSNESAELVGDQPYLPHFYLGLALYRMNNCVLAMDEWEMSRTQGVVQARPSQFQQLVEYRSRCEPLVLDPAIAQARKRIEDASGFAGLAEKQLVDPEMAEVWRVHPELADSLRAALKRLTEVSAEVDAAVSRRRLGDILAADRAAEQVKDTLRASVNEAVGHLTQDLEQRQRGEDEKKSSIRQQIRQLTSKATELIQPLARREASGDGGAARLGTELTRLSGAVAELDSAVSLEELEVLRRELSGAIHRAESALRQPLAPLPLRRPALPQPLVKASEAYFRGDYLIALELLDVQSFDDASAKAQGYLFRAAARFARYRMTSRSDESLLRAAEADVRACRSFDGALTPEKKLFSSSFRRFFEDSAAGD